MILVSKTYEMDSHDTPNCINQPEISQTEIRDISRSVLGRALHDLRATADYNNINTKMCAVDSPTEGMYIGEEVRAWFNDLEGYELFSFRMCCDLSGYDFKRVLKIAEPHLIPKDRHLSSWINSQHEIMELLRENPGIADYSFKKKLKGTHHPTALRWMKMRMIEDGRIEKKRDGRENAVRWYLKEV